MATTNKISHHINWTMPRYILQIRVMTNIKGITELILVHQCFQLGWKRIQVTTIQCYYVKLWKQIIISIMLTITSKRTGNFCCCALVEEGSRIWRPRKSGSMEGWSRLLKQLDYQSLYEMRCASGFTKTPKIRMKMIRLVNWAFHHFLLPPPPLEAFSSNTLPMGAQILPSLIQPQSCNV